MLSFEWDPDKNARNVAKHGVAFETAVRIFDGPVFTAIDARNDYGEVRYVSIGMVEMAAVLVVVHTDRNGRIRIVSARPASRRERARYEDALRKAALDRRDRRDP